MVMIQEEWEAQASGDDEALGFGKYTWLRGERGYTYDGIHILW